MLSALVSAGIETGLDLQSLLAEFNLQNAGSWLPGILSKGIMLVKDQTVKRMQNLKEAGAQS